MPSFNPSALWEARPHTLAKIEIVRRYLFLWFSILGNNPKNKRLVYIDGFAGPGKYSNSEQSSPVAALQAAKAAIERAGARLNDVEFSFLFVEKRKEFTENLRSVVSAGTWPANIKWTIEQGNFEENVGGVLEELKQQGHRLAPTFAFIDPFGATGLPFRVVSEILSYPSCEVLLNLDSDGISRLITAQEFQKNQQNLNALFGVVMAAYIGGNAYRIYWCYKHEKEGMITPLVALYRWVKAYLDKTEQLAREQFEKQKQQLQQQWSAANQQRTASSLKA